MAATLFLLVSPLLCQQITVDATPGHATNSFNPLHTLGAGIDRDPLDSVQTIYDPDHVATMLSAGWGPISYRLNTERSIQAWHWNPAGNWSDATGQGYFVGDADSAGQIARSFGYNLPHRGTTSNYGTSGGYSMLNDGDLSTYWKSNPYLDQTFTGEDNSLHPGWIIVDLGQRTGVNAIQIVWANPYATDYLVQYWTGGDPVGDPANGNWITFPDGTITGGQGGTVLLPLAPSTIKVEFVRVLMTASASTCDTHGPADVRNCLGFAINEVYLGYLDAKGRLVDLMDHSPDDGQTLTYASSVDSWHTPAGIATDDGEQPGFDLVFHSGLTRGLPMTIPVAMLYDNPENAANEIAYIRRHGYAINYVELGEEPDGQFVVPEDDAALYIQWADAIHKLSPHVRLAGPVFEGVNSDVQAWRDAHGNVSWFNRFLQYLDSHGHLGDLDVMTFEHYPFDPCNLHWNDLYDEPQLVKGIMKVWRQDGLPRGVPMEITETNLAYDTATRYMRPFGALWLADFAGSFLTNGGHALFYYQWEPIPMYRGCGGWGTFGMFNTDWNYNVKQNTAQFFAAQMLTQEWVRPVDETHTVYPAVSDITDGDGHVLVTAYSVLRPRGEWSLLLVNKDRVNPRSVQIDFHDSLINSDQHFHGDVTQVSWGADNYAWHAMGENSYADPDGPAVTSTQPGGKGVLYTLPAASITVLRGRAR
ncbi:MAG: discoidin domain-containing protein [Terriglobales bacterium]